MVGYKETFTSLVPASFSSNLTLNTLFTSVRLDDKQDHYGPWSPPIDIFSFCSFLCLKYVFCEIKQFETESECIKTNLIILTYIN